VFASVVDRKLPRSYTWRPVWKVGEGTGVGDAVAVVVLFVPAA
jgi:hypothetical protein